MLKHPSNPFWVGEDIQSNMAVGSDVRMWATAISTNAQNGRKIIFRYAKAFDESFDRTSQPIRIIVVWKYQSDTGQPSAEEHERMNVFEDALVTRSVESGPLHRTGMFPASATPEEWITGNSELISLPHYD